MIDLDITSSSYVYLDFEYDRALIRDLKKSIPGRQYVDTSNRPKQWKFKLDKTTLKPFLQFCQRHRDRVEIPRSIRNRMDEIVAEARAHEREKEENRRIMEKPESELVEVKGLARGMNLYTFQRRAVEYVERNRKVIIGDQQGLGKTITSIASIHHLDAYPCLVVCPATLKYNWENEWNAWLPRKTVKVQEASEGLDLRSRVTVINYDILWRYREELRERGYKGLILDESQFVKNGSAKRSKAARQIAKRMDEEDPVLLLSGTAMMNRPKDLPHQLKIIDVFKQEFGTWQSFAKRFCAARQTRWGLKADGASNTKELHERLVDTCYVRRNKRDVASEIPDKQRQRIEVALTNRPEYERAEEDIVEYVREQAVKDPEFLERISHLSESVQEVMKRRERRNAEHSAMMAEQLMRIMKLKKLAADGKLRHVKTWLGDFNTEDAGPVIMFAWHREVVNAIADHFDAPRIMGGVSARDRQRIVDEFQDGEHDILVMNIQSGGTGLTLTEASNLVFVELPWTWSEVEQAEDRIHRIGQENTANIYMFLGRDSIDLDMFEMLESKRIVSEQVNAGRDITDDEGNIVEGVIRRMADRVSDRS